MKQDRQLVRASEDFIRADLSAGAVKVLFLLAAAAQAGGGNTALISNARIAERTGLTNISRLIKELYAAVYSVLRSRKRKWALLAVALDDTGAVGHGARHYHFLLQSACGARFHRQAAVYLQGRRLRLQPHLYNAYAAPTQHPQGRNVPRSRKRSRTCV